MLPDFNHHMTFPLPLSHTVTHTIVWLISWFENNFSTSLVLLRMKHKSIPGMHVCCGCAIAAYILFPSLTQYPCVQIVNLFIIPIYYDGIPYLISSSFYSILSGTSVAVQIIALHYTYAHKPVLILVICFTYLVSLSHTVLFHMTCVLFLTWIGFLIFISSYSWSGISLDRRLLSCI